MGQLGVSVRLTGLTKIDLEVRLDGGPWERVFVGETTANFPAEPDTILATAAGQKHIALRGSATIDGVSHPFEKSCPILDTSGWTSPLNDSSLSLANRLSDFAAGLAAIDEMHGLDGYLPGAFVVAETPIEPKDVGPPDGVMSLAAVTVNRSTSQKSWSDLPQFWPFPSRPAWDVLAFNVHLAGHAEDFAPHVGDDLAKKYARSFCAAHDPSQSALIYLCYDPEDQCPWYWLSSRDIGYPEHLRMPDGTPMNAEQAVIDFVHHRVVRPMKDELYYAEKRTSPTPLNLDLGYAANALQISLTAQSDGVDVRLFASP